MFIGDDYIPDQDYESEEEEEYYYYQDMIEAEKNRDLSWLYEDDDPYANEEWRPIPGYEGLYEVSNMGRVKSLKRYKRNHSVLQEVPEKILAGEVNHGGYLIFNLCKDGKAHNCQAHQLVAKAFIPNPENKLYVDHFDTNKLNNKVNNLEWATFEENANNELTKMHNSKAKKGVYIGRKVSEETKEKIRQANLGREVSEETREKLRKLHQGKKVSPESIQKRIDTMIAKGIGFDTNTGRHRIFDEETGRYKYVY